MLAGPAAAACVEVEADADWAEISPGGPVLDAYASGLWAAAPDLRPTGPGGHPDGTVAPGAAERVAALYPFGALLIANEARRVWTYRDFSRTVMGALMGGRAFAPGPLYARINDAPDGLADNTGSITLCLERPG